jgi:deoxyribodipyrimidine photo-lyase
MNFLPLTRLDALKAWSDFLPGIAQYAKQRNHVEPPHRNVSRLSAALRFRTLLEDEVLRDSLQQHPFQSVEKWVQEVCWRRYWKGWLERRPDVWDSWRRRMRELNETLPEAIRQRAQAVAAGESGVACMDAIVRELIATGYVHNHARMWWASYWIHAERLPWELGADVFYRYLLDADAASNTLSWRWVAGLQTPGKTYLVRASNIEKYAPDLLHRHPAGIERIADGSVTPLVAAEFANTARQALLEYPAVAPSSGRRVGIWLHMDDLVPEIGPLANLAPVSVAAFSQDHANRHTLGLSERSLAAQEEALADGLARAASHFSCPIELKNEVDPAACLTTWALNHGLEEVVAFAPTVGPVADLLPHVRQLLHSSGITLTLIRRASDSHAFELAGSGFFPFWEKMSRHLRQQKNLFADL